ncbi:complex I NDUFA9 subunit family protein [Stakelama saccharophila]|uniref:Complex I NDUFA9 subunit family protein n=1 Tax=Stakelama saccharophila TaxID=3075605 RepID=A0ABZ0BA96_9SPHN|nr:complex I NDUFA9 subunit family protein [Stakelama sp. W311]WNO54122.1 complex I NDUFA9 subunit family protein [Stakelama sp. W311]
MKDKLVTLFGGGGFLGRYIAQDLLARGIRVRIAQRDPRQAWFLKPLGNLGQTQFVAADVTRPETLERAVAGADAVVNLVGILSGDFEAVHVAGAGNVARAAADARVPALVHISAIGADPDSPSAYGRSKAKGEAAVRDAFPAATILRPSIVFGREDSFVNRFARMAAAPVLPVIAARTRFQPIYAADVAAAVVKAIVEPGAHAGQTCELGGPDVIAMGDLVRWIAKTTGRKPVIVEVPDGAASLLASLPGAPITRDQLCMLRHDNVVSGSLPGIEAFGVRPTPLATVAPSWLVQYRRHGRFGLPSAA